MLSIVSDVASTKKARSSVLSMTLRSGCVLIKATSANNGFFPYKTYLIYSLVSVVSRMRWRHRWPNRCCINDRRISVSHNGLFNWLRCHRLCRHWSRCGIHSRRRSIFVPEITYSQLNCCAQKHGENGNDKSTFVLFPKIAHNDYLCTKVGDEGIEPPQSATILSLTTTGFTAQCMGHLRIFTFWIVIHLPILECIGD